MKRGNMTKQKSNLNEGFFGGNDKPPAKDAKTYDRYATGEVSQYSEQIEVPPHLRKLLNAKLAARALAKR